MEDYLKLAADMRKRAEIRRGIPRGEPDRISDQLEAAAAAIETLRRQLKAADRWYDEEYPPEDGHDQVRPWDHVR